MMTMKSIKQKVWKRKQKTKLIYLHGVIDGIVVKLDADAGTGLDTDYTAALRSELPVAAGLTGGTSTIAAISAAIAAYSA